MKCFFRPRRLSSPSAAGKRIRNGARWPDTGQCRHAGSGPVDDQWRSVQDAVRRGLKSTGYRLNPEAPSSRDAGFRPTGDTHVTGDTKFFFQNSAEGVAPMPPEGWRGGHRGMTPASPGEWRPCHRSPPSCIHPQGDGLPGAFPENRKKREPASPCPTSLPPPSSATGGESTSTGWMSSPPLTDPRGRSGAGLSGLNHRRLSLFHGFQIRIPATRKWTPMLTENGLTPCGSKNSIPRDALKTRSGHSPK
ncbi:MAG: hypothetical protein JWM59_2058 [Verrucomicrobiales bacterium]|nr:hypothetical protein [Verrucomicrobiales bacterium]